MRYSALLFREIGWNSMCLYTSILIFLYYAIYSSAIHVAVWYPSTPCSLDFHALLHRSPSLMVRQLKTFFFSYIYVLFHFMPFAVWVCVWARVIAPIIFFSHNIWLFVLFIPLLYLSSFSSIPSIPSSYTYLYVSLSVYLYLLLVWACLCIFDHTKLRSKYKNWQKRAKRKRAMTKKTMIK